MEQLRNGDMTLTNPNSLLGRVFASGDVIMTNDVYRHTKRGGFPPGHPRIDNYLGVPIFSDDHLIGMFAIANSKQPLNQAMLDWLQPFTDTCSLLINLYRQMAEREQVMRDLGAARDLAEKADQAKSEFLSSMSHELRTPLNAIIGFAQLLGKTRRAPLNGKQQRQVGQIEKSSQHLLSLINEILDLAKIEAGHMPLSIEPILIKNVLDDACNTLEANLEAAGIRLTRTPLLVPWHVAADYTRTKQVLLNLLSNAIKYNRQDGTINIAAEQCGNLLPLNARIGISCSQARFDTERLVHMAALALPQKDCPRVQHYGATLEAQQRQRFYLQQALRGARQRGEMSLAFQPKLSLTTQCIIGAEALLRWHHPEIGHISPVVFIPLAEASGDILAIGEWVLEQTMQHIVAWRANGLLSDDFHIAVNVAARQLARKDFAERLLSRLAKHNIPERFLAPEVTESGLMSDIHNARVQLSKLAKVNIAVAIDDFGTGHSSLAYIKTLPFSTLKIDRVFVMDLETSAIDRQLARTITQFAYSVGCDVVAEGIETAEQAA